MKILFFNYEFPPLGGGAGNASFYLLSEYAKNPEIQVDFVTASIDGQYHQLKMGENVTIHRLPIGKNADNIHYQTKQELIAYTWKAFWFARKLAKKNSYDLTHSFFSVPCGFISMLLKWEFGLPYIISLRGSDVPGYSERFVGLYRWVTPTILRIWKGAEFVVANSQGLKELALRSGTKKEIGVVYNGIAVNEFFPQVENLNSEQFTIICVSRVTPRKGIRFLIQAFKILSGRYENMRLLIVGDGNEKKSLEDLVQGLDLKDKVEFAGIVSHDKLLPYYQRADVFVLPSLNEGMSNVMLEALACGLPVVATETGGTKELLTDGLNGLVVRMKDADDIADKIERLILDRNLKNAMSLESRKLAETLSWGNVAGEYVAMYKKISNLRRMREE
ncbi:MAG: glycosyl transferase group 1 protein [uncultured bacterium]|nr:MAG: glycosyl transferase group 1 protein [uncultured bacterium]